MSPAIFNLNRPGAHRATLRRSPYGTVPFSFQEFARFEAMLHPERIDGALFAERLQKGFVGWGEALTAALYLGVIERGVDVRVNARVTELAINGDVSGVEAEIDGHREHVEARRGVVLCCGGYEWDAGRVASQFNGVGWVPSTVPTNRGDGWRMAEQAHAAMGNEHACWGWPSYLIPGELQADGHPLVRTGLVERCLPHFVLLNRHGRRFVDETLPYHRINKLLIERDADGESRHLPAYHVFDQQFRDKYAFGPVHPAQPSPDWLKRYATLDELARATGMPAAALAATLKRYNDDVRAGKDLEFHRGEEPYGRFWGDPDNPRNPCLGTLERAPYYAVEVVPSTIGTCGGPRIDSSARVLREDGRAIPGLFAAGNVTSAVSGPSYFGPGGTIGPAMVFGVIGGRTAAANGG
jgi:succinate dehydrogenase/fumarate reductase flavoprotein subunit